MRFNCKVAVESQANLSFPSVTVCTLNKLSCKRVANQVCSKAGKSLHYRWEEETFVVGTKGVSIAGGGAGASFQTIHSIYLLPLTPTLVHWRPCSS